MSRILKFRAWNSIVMVYQDFPKGGLTASEILKRFDNVMQFTGERDNKNNEIYEGDVVQYFDTFFSPRELFVVDFSNGMFYLKSVEDDEYNANFLDIQPVEVIGNIYENGDLIK